MKRSCMLVFALVALLAAAPANAQKPPAFTWQTVDVAGAEATYAAAVNARGDIAGYYTLDGIDHGFLLRKGELVTIDAPEPTTFATWPLAVSDTGEVAGLYRYPGACPACPPWLNFQMRGFTWRDGVFEVVHLPDASYTLVTAINVKGDIVGEYWDGKVFGFQRRDGVFTRLDMSETASDPLSWSAAYGINARGEVTGWFGDGATFEIHGYLLRDGECTTIDAPDYSWNTATAVNDRGQVVLNGYENWAIVANYLWRDGVLTEIPAFSGSTSTAVKGINANGVIVGNYRADDGKTHGFVARPK